MKLTKRDLVTIAAVVLALVVLILSTTREKAKRVPADDKHRAFYEAVEKGGDRTEVEKGCITCHNPQSIPLPEKHPPKEQCLICHKLSKQPRPQGGALKPKCYAIGQNRDRETSSG